MDNSQSTPETVIEVLVAGQLREVLHRYGEALRLRRKGIDKLNVYPVPDGDTGTNMSLTVQSVVAELHNAVSDDMASVSAAISKGAIMGARGNSGAILAQVLRGVAESAKEKTSLNPHDVAEALEKARKSAYESVLKPVEGTILTVVTAAATAAKEQAEKGSALKEQLDHIRHASAEALARTPDLLPVLKQAGVVDAGGSGFLLFVDALRYVVTGEPIPGAIDSEDDEEAPDLSHVQHSELSELHYEIMFLLEGDDSGIPAFREAWSHVGDSIVVVGGDGLWNCHIHSNDPGQPIEIALDFGRPRQIRITNLMEQVGAEHGDQGDHGSHAEHGGSGDHGGNWVSNVLDVQNQSSSSGSSFSDSPSFNPSSSPCTTAVVAVVNGNGMSRIYRSFGVQELVIGGQSMNPSVAELLHAVEAAPADCVVVLPNNKNVIAAARQVNDLSKKSVEVIPTRSVVQGMSALIAYNSELELQANIEAMTEACSHVIVGEVTQAVRDTTVSDATIRDTTVSDATDSDRPIKKGDWLGLDGDGIAVIASTLTEVLCNLVEVLASDDHEVLTLIEGANASEETTEALKTWLTEHRPNVEMEVHVGGQPLYPYLFGVE